MEGDDGKMDRKAVARETINIMRQGYYEIEDGSRTKRIEIAEDMKRSVRQSVLITPAQGEEILRKYEAEEGEDGCSVADWRNQGEVADGSDGKDLMNREETSGGSDDKGWANQGEVLDKSDGKAWMNQGEIPDRSDGRSLVNQEKTLYRSDGKGQVNQEEFLGRSKAKEEFNQEGGDSDSRHAKERIRIEIYNISTVDAIRKLSQEGRKRIGVLNFASAKNPGGGFINGAMAQEESLATSSTLYRTLTAHEEYYRENRARSSMMYTDYGIYSPDVAFFRDGKFKLVEKPVYASVLTLPAVNMGQVLLKGEDAEEARRVMRRRMKLALAIFADQGAKNLVLGAYGCGVFRNDPVQVAVWWKEIMEEGFEQYFESVVYAVLDTSRGGACIRAFQEVMKEQAG